MFVFLAVLLVLSLVHELFDLLLVFNEDLDDPSVSLSFSVNKTGVSLDILVVSDDLASDWGIDVSGSLNTFNTADTVSLVELSANISDVQVDDVTELTLSEVGNTDLGFLKYEKVRVEEKVSNRSFL